MKRKGFFVSALVSLTLGIGLFSGITIGNKTVKEAKAEQTAWYVVGTFGGANKWSHSTGYAMTNTTGDTWVYEGLSFAANDEFKICDEEDKNWQGGWSYNNGSSSAAIKEIFTAAGDGANIVCNTAGVYDITFTKNDWHIKIEENVSETFTVTKYAVLDGVKQEEPIGSESVVEGNTYAVPSEIKKGLYTFGGWYTDVACQNAYVATVLTGDLDLYAKYTLKVTDSYFYYVTGSNSPTNNNVYSFGGTEQFGSWPGTLITNIPGVQEVHGVLNFQGTEQLIYKIPYVTTDNDTNVIINYQGSSQTSDLLLVEHTALWWISYSDTNGDDVDDNKNYHNDDAGLALDLLLDAEAKRNAVTASGGIADYSVCGISASDAASLYNRYYAMTAEQKAYVDATTTYTYNGTDTSTQTSVYYSAVMAQLKAIAVAGDQAVSGAKFIGLLENNNNVLLIVIVSAVAITSAIGLFFIIKRRKYN